MESGAFSVTTESSSASEVKLSFRCSRATCASGMRRMPLSGRAGVAHRTQSIGTVSGAAPLSLQTDQALVLCSRLCPQDLAFRIYLAFGIAIRLGALQYWSPTAWGAIFPHMTRASHHVARRLQLIFFPIFQCFPLFILFSRGLGVPQLLAALRAAKIIHTRPPAEKGGGGARIPRNQSCAAQRKQFRDGHDVGHAPRVLHSQIASSVRCHSAARSAPIAILPLCLSVPIVTTRSGTIYG